MKYRVKLEFELDSDLNVAQVRDRLKLVVPALNGIHPIVAGLRALVQVPDGGLCTVTSYSASHATRYGRKPESVDGSALLRDADIVAKAEGHAPDDIDSIRASERFVD